MMLTGTVWIDGNGPAGRSGRLYITLEDVTKIDLSAVVVARAEQRVVVAGGPQTQGIAFHLAVDGLDPALRYGVRALLDLDADQRPGVGDYISVRSYPVDATSETGFLSIDTYRID